MRILHTGDWHVGKALRGRSRADEHRAVLEEIVEIAAGKDDPGRKADLVLVAGDLFDTAAPSPESEQIVYRALLGLAQTGAEVVVIAGNHDNPRRLEAVQPLLELTNVHVAPALRRPDDGGVLELEVGGETARIALLPFLSQRGIVKADDLMSAEADEHSGQYAERAQRIVQALCGGASDGTVNLLLAHVMAHGGVLGGGERSAHTIFEYSVPTAAFPGSLHYVALGHLHRAQRLEGASPIWYSGSPLQLDFGETEDVKSVNLVEANPGRPAQVEKVPLESGRRLRTMRGTLGELEELAAQGTEDYLRVDVDAPPSAGLADRVRELLPNAVDVRILRPETGDESDGARPQRLGRSPIELFREYLAELGEEDEQLIALFRELLDEEEGDAAAAP